MNVGQCTDAIESSAEAVLVWIVIVSVLGLLWHIWLTRRLSFVNFLKDEPSGELKAKDLTRLLLPFIMVVIVSIILPLIYYYSSSYLASCLNTSSFTEFVKFPWNMLLPAKEWSLTLLMDAGLGALLYWMWGGICWVVTR